MSKPAYWLVFSPGKETRKFTTRMGAKLYAGALAAMGQTVIIKALGY